MSSEILNKFVLGASLSLVLCFSGASIAQKGMGPICHHPPGQKDHGQDTLLDSGEGHYGERGNAHLADHPPVNGSCDLGGGTTEVPEPITMLLFGAGLAGVGYAAKRRKAKNL